MSIQEKHEALRKYIASLGSVAVAFSGGVDSTLLLKVAHDVLGDKALAVTVSASFTSTREIDEAASFCQSEGISQVTLHVEASDIEGFTSNPPDRCYICKHAIFTRILQAANRHGTSHVADGSNLDDLGDYRPGMKALGELGIKSPLRECSFTKSDVRELSRELGLPTWDKPATACLASRFVYGEEITPEKLLMVERAEELMRSMGFRQFRVRIHGRMARIELLPEDFGRVLQEEARTKIYGTLKELGFSYVTLDLKGYRTGSMNETIKP